MRLSSRIVILNYYLVLLSCIVICYLILISCTIYLVLLSPNVILHSSVLFYSTFWSLAMYDLHVPSTSYEKQIVKHKSQQTNTDDSKDLVSAFFILKNLLFL